MKSAACDSNGKLLKKGQKVKQGDVIGIRGGSPYVDNKAKYGIHLHLYVTNAITTGYAWDVLRKNVINPYPLLYKSKNIKYNVLSTSDSAMMNSLKYLEDVTIKVVPAVERDVMKDQLIDTSSNLRVRTAPSLDGSVIGYLKANCWYNYFDSKVADGYTWYKLTTNEFKNIVDQWCAKTSTMTVYPGKTEVEMLREEVERLTNALTTVNAELEEAIEINKQLTDDIKIKEDENKALEEQNTTLIEENSILESTNDTLTTKITDALEILKL